jgi:hypothetical protein
MKKEERLRIVEINEKVVDVGCVVFVESRASSFVSPPFWGTRKIFFISDLRKGCPGHKMKKCYSK